MDGIAGVTAMETRLAGTTVRLVDPLMDPDAAEIFAFPIAMLVASPAVEITATVDVSELQVTEAEMSCVLPSEYVPVAANCFVVPAAMDGFDGVTAMDSRTAGRTVSDTALD